VRAVEFIIKTAESLDPIIMTNLFGLVSTDPDQLYTVDIQSARKMIGASSRQFIKLRMLSQHGVSWVAIKTGARGFRHDLRS
jgi:hypothetical protein